ncbi:XRE family transcriptional regulator [Streptomyces sp. WG7]|uniref:XRE family transcriptional regulator n=1 Tax=Streptomyces sp. WG7 TaxID=3417650 RepID=UPI003CF00391
MRTLRTEAGKPSYRTMAKRAHYSVATLSEAARGLHKPSLRVTLAYVAACGGDLELWSRRWHSVSKELEARAAPGHGRPGGAERESSRSGRRPAAHGVPERGTERGAAQRSDLGPDRNRSTDHGPDRNAARGAGPDRNAARGPGRDPEHGRGHSGRHAPTTSAHGRSGDELTRDERAELRRLRSEVEELRRANEVLKAASAIFAADLRTTSKVVYNPAGRQDRSA